METKQGKWSWCVVFVIAMVVCAQRVHANEDVEREELTRILNEIIYLKKSLILARNRAEKNASTQFDYDALAADLNHISEGISDHLNRIRREPRTLPAIDGEYRHGR